MDWTTVSCRRLLTWGQFKYPIYVSCCWLVSYYLTQWRCGYSSWMRSSRIIHRILTTVQLRCLWPRQISLFSHSVQAYTIETPRWSISYRGSWMNRFDLTWFTVLAHDSTGLELPGVVVGGWNQPLPPVHVYRRSFSFWVKIGFKFQSLGKISNISTSVPQFF